MTPVEIFALSIYAFFRERPKMMEQIEHHFLLTDQEWLRAIVDMVRMVVSSFSVEAHRATISEDLVIARAAYDVLIGAILKLFGLSTAELEEQLREYFGTGVLALQKLGQIAKFIAIWRLDEKDGAPRREKEKEMTRRLLAENKVRSRREGWRSRGEDVATEEIIGELWNWPGRSGTRSYSEIAYLFAFSIIQRSYSPSNPDPLSANELKQFLRDDDFSFRISSDGLDSPEAAAQLFLALGRVKLPLDFALDVKSCFRKRDLFIHTVESIRTRFPCTTA